MTQESVVEHECASCGVTSTAENYFVPNPGQFRGKSKLCVTCAAYKHRFGAGLFSIATSAAVAFYWGAALTDSATGALVFLLTTPAITFFAIVLHELGHGVAGAAVGARIVALSFGGGRNVKVVRHRNRFYLFGWRPIEGMTLITDVPEQGYRWRMIVVFFAGPLVNLVVATPALLYLLEHGFRVTDIGGALILLWALINGLMGIFNLFPFQSASGFGVAYSDGRQILNHLIMRSDDLETGRRHILLSEIFFEWLHGDVHRAEQLVQVALQGYEDQVDTAVLASAILLETGKFDAGIEICRHVLTTELESEQRAVVENNLACLLMELDDDSLLPEVDQLTRATMRLLPMMMAVRSTRGAYLVRVEQYAEALKILDDERYQLEPDRNQGTVACALAKAYIGLGMYDEAQQTISRARRLGARLQHVDEVEERLAMAVSQTDT